MAVITPNDGNGWDEWKNLVLDKLGLLDQMMPIVTRLDTRAQAGSTAHLEDTLQKLSERVAERMTAHDKRLDRLELCAKVIGGVLTAIVIPLIVTGAGEVVRALAALVVVKP